jgi:hypothetical protein
LADGGEQVRLVTRSGGGPVHPAIERFTADASNADALSHLDAGVDVIYSCGASPVSEHREGEVRVRIWKEALDEHLAGRIRTAEVRSSDDLGAGAVTPDDVACVAAAACGQTVVGPG